MSNAREQLKSVAKQMYLKAADAHAKGMGLIATSSRIDQFAVICSDSENEAFLNLLIEEGMVMIVDGAAVALEQGEPSARVDIKISSSGGNT